MTAPATKNALLSSVGTSYTPPAKICLVNATEAVFFHLEFHQDSNRNQPVEGGGQDVANPVL